VLQLSESVFFVLNTVGFSGPAFVTIWIHFRSFSRQDSLPRHLEELPEDDPFPLLPAPAPLVPPLDLRGNTNKRLQHQQQQQLHQQQQQLQSINTRAFSKDPHYEEQHGERRHPDPPRVGRRNPAFAPDTGGSPVTYYPKIKDSLSLARARLDADLADDVSGGAETTFGGGAYAQWPEVGGAGGGGIQGLQELLLQGGAVQPLPRPRDSIEIYQEHYLQVRTTENKDDV
jgi:hypothetical protein